MESGSVGTKSLIGIMASARMGDAARLMADRDIGALGVYASDARNLVGVVTERDVTHAVARGLDPVQTGVTEVMTDSPVIVNGPLTRSAAVRLMRERHIRHLVVKDGDADRIVSIRDV